MILKGFICGRPLHMMSDVNFYCDSTVCRGFIYFHIGLTAVRADLIYDLMARDYPQKYKVSASI